MLEKEIDAVVYITASDTNYVEKPRTHVRFCTVSTISIYYTPLIYPMFGNLIYQQTCNTV